MKKSAVYTFQNPRREMRGEVLFFCIPDIRKITRCECRALVWENTRELANEHRLGKTRMDRVCGLGKRRVASSSSREKMQMKGVDRRGKKNSALNKPMFLRLGEFPVLPSSLLRATRFLSLDLQKKKTETASELGACSRHTLPIQFTFLLLVLPILLVLSAAV